MPKYLTQYNASDLLEKLHEGGFISERQRVSNYITEDHQSEELPSFLRFLVGVGALITSLCFLSFLRMTHIIDFRHKEGIMVWGLAFVVFATILQRVVRQENSITRSFLIQLSLAFMVLGKVLFAGSMADLFGHGWPMTWGLLIITSITYPIYKVSIDRFLSPFVVLISTLLNILQHSGLFASEEQLLNGFILLHIIVILLASISVRRDIMPFTYAFILSLCINILFVTSLIGFGHTMHKEVFGMTFINGILTGGLIALFGWAAGDIKKLKTKPLMWATAGTLILGLISAPGILLSIGLMVLGYAKHKSLLIILGIILMPVFLFLYYYSLETSLAQKSAVLIGSGLVLLLVRICLIRGVLGEGNVPCAQK